MKLVIVRHGKTQGNVEGRYIGSTDGPLLFEETAVLKERRAKCPAVAAVFTSPLLRCRQTADLLYPKQAHFVIPDFREMDFGEFENKNYAELNGDPRYQAWIDSGGVTAFPGGESREHFQKRSCDAFCEMIRLCVRNDWDSAALTVHGGTIMSILGAYGLPRQDYFSWQTGNGCGYVLDTDAQAFLEGRMGLAVNEIIR